MARTKKTASPDNENTSDLTPLEEVIMEAIAEASPPIGSDEPQKSEVTAEATLPEAPSLEGATPATNGDASAPDDPAREDDVIHLTLSLPVKMFDQSPGSMQRLKAAITSKKTLLKKALGTDSLEVVIREDRVMFPWFTLTSEGNATETDAYSKLVFALAKKAITQVRVDPVEKVPDDLQLGMRLYLINLEFKGDDYKSARAVLMRNFAKTGGSPVKDKKYELTMPEVYKP